MNDTQRLVAAIEELTEAVGNLAVATDESGPEPPAEPEPPTADGGEDEWGPAERRELLEGSIERYEVPVSKVNVTHLPDREEYQIKERFRDMNDTEVANFREWTEASDNIEVGQWGQTNEGTYFPEFFVISYNAIENGVLP